MDLSLYRVDVSPGDVYDPDAVPEWTVYCGGVHDDPKDRTVVNLLNVMAGTWESYDLPELVEIIRKHHEKFHIKHQEDHLCG